MGGTALNGAADPVGAVQLRHEPAGTGLGVAASCRRRCPFACSFTGAASWRSSARAVASMWRVASGSKQRRKPPRERRRRLDQSRVHRRRSLGGARAPVRWLRATRLVRRCGDPCGRSYARSFDPSAGSRSRPMAELPSNRFDGAHGGVILRRPSEHSSEHFPRRHEYPSDGAMQQKRLGLRAILTLRLPLATVPACLTSRKSAVRARHRPSHKALQI